MTPQIEKVAQTLHFPDESRKQITISGSTQRKPVFDHNKVVVIFVLGGPGAGVLRMLKRLV